MNPSGTSQPRALLQHDFEELSDNAGQPPAGYVFVPKGDVYVTRHCRNLTRVAGRKLWVVFDRKTNERLGIHCFQQIVEAVKADATITEEKRQKAVAAKDSRDHKQAHRLLLQFFPNIPEGACSEILQHGFQKGSGRVGRSHTLENKIKVQLAVNAHIRHRLTLYDSILAANTGQDARIAAREMVYGQVQAIADSWRATSSQAPNSRSRTSLPMVSSIPLKDHRQHRTQPSITHTTRTSEAGVAEAALEGLRLDENEPEARARAEADQRLVQKKAQKAARKATRAARKPDSGTTTRDLLREYDVNPRIKISKKKKKEVLRLQRDLQSVPSGKHHNLMKRIKREKIRKAKFVTKGVVLEPRTTDIDPPRQSRYPLRSNHGKFATNSETPGDGMQLEPDRDDRSVSTESPSADYTNEGKLLVADSDWMDIDDLSLWTAGVHLS